MTKASSVPIDTSAAASRTVRNPAGIATATPRTICVMYGVRYVGWILLTKAGRSPSCDMVQNTRAWPMSWTRITDERPAIAPISISRVIQPSPAASATLAIGSGTSSNW